MIDTILFDLDGTLLNTLEDLKNSANFALKKFGFPIRTLDEVRRFVGNGLRRLTTALSVAPSPGADTNTAKVHNQIYILAIEPLCRSRKVPAYHSVAKSNFKEQENENV